VLPEKEGAELGAVEALVGILTMEFFLDMYASGRDTGLDMPDSCIGRCLLQGLMR
jgi:hypothetical protein